MGELPRPADKLGTRMTQLALILLVVTAAGCATSGAVPRPFPSVGQAPPQDVVAGPAVSAGAPSYSSAFGYGLAGTALALRGVPYRNGGSDPSGFDCSGLVWYVFAQHGLHVPRTVAEQYRTGSQAQGDLEPGDLLFFSTTTPGPSHVGILIGNDEFVHAPSSTGQVRVERLSAPYWGSRYLGARRSRN